MDQGEQRESGIAQPAIAIVPVPGTADLFRERAGWGGDDPTGRGVGQGFKGDEGALDGIAPFAAIGSVSAPIGPIGFGGVQRLVRIGCGGRWQMRRTVGEQKDLVGSGFDSELGAVQIVGFGFERDGGSEDDERWPGDGANAEPGADPRHPGNDGAVFEPEGDFELHLDAPSKAFNDSDDGGVGGVDRHEVDQKGGAIIGFECGFEDHGAGPVAARDAGGRIFRADLPSAGLGRIEQRAEAGGAVEAGPAEPVYRAVAADQGGGLAVADQAVFLEIWRELQRFRQAGALNLPGHTSGRLNCRGTSRSCRPGRRFPWGRRMGRRSRIGRWRVAGLGKSGRSRLLAAARRRRAAGQYTGGGK